MHRLRLPLLAQCGINQINNFRVVIFKLSINVFNSTKLNKLHDWMHECLYHSLLTFICHFHAVTKLQKLFYNILSWEMAVNTCRWNRRHSHWAARLLYPISGLQISLFFLLRQKTVGNIGCKPFLQLVYYRARWFRCRYVFRNENDHTS